MAVRIRGYVDYDYVGAGTGGSAFDTAEANNPGLGTVGNAQTLRLQAMVPVQAVNPAAPTQAELQTATTALATLLNTLITTQVTAQIDGWSSGNP